MWIDLRCQVSFFLTCCDVVLRRTLITNSRMFSAHRLSVTRSTKLTSARALFEVNKATRIFGTVVVAKCRFIALLYLHLPNDGIRRYFSIWKHKNKAASRLWNTEFRYSISRYFKNREITFWLFFR